MAEDRITSQGLQTDPPPERLGDAAFRLKNLIPASESSVKPRPGVSLVAHYQPNAIGRSIVLDALPGDLSQGIMVTCLNTTLSGVTFTHQTDGLGIFRPRKIATDYSAVRGFTNSVHLHGVVL